MQDLVLIAGGGTMGAGIAFVAAQGGYGVELVEPSPEARERASNRIGRNAARAGDDSIPRRITMLDTMPSRSEAAIALEAVPEHFEIKVQTLTRLAACVSSQSVLATNTSSFSVADLGDTLSAPQRVAGLHFFNPPEVMALVEVVRTPQTDDAAVDRAFEFVRRIGKTAILTADAPGFVVNRVARPYYLQAMRALERGVASIEELDALARAVGFRMGPFELMDFIGLDVNLATTQSVFARTDAPRLAPLALQEDMVSRGLLGRKSGAGFYDYRDASPQRMDASVEAPSGAPIAGEVVTLIGFGPMADALTDLLSPRYADMRTVENDDSLGDVSAETTIAIDVGDGASDRSDAVVALDRLLTPEAIIFVDAYATDRAACAARLKHPERLVGYGILGSPAMQNAVEIVDAPEVSDDALALAQELFENLGKGVVLVADEPGLFVGRCVGCIVNEAVTVVENEIASPDDVDTAMRLGTNYPLGPIAWGREIGGRRIARILTRVARAEGNAFLPHRALWVLDVDDEAQPDAPQSDAELPPLGAGAL